ncbi:MAG: cation:dicarboxylate symporter family transporter, partial [bacterium]
MTSPQNEPQGIAEYDSAQASTDVLETGPTTPDLSAIWRILVAMVLGVVVGLALGKSAALLGLVGSKIIGMIKTLAGPLILFAVIESFLKTEMTWSQARKMLRIAAINGCVAVAIGLTLANVIQPGVGWKPSTELTESAKSATIKPTDR